MEMQQNREKEVACLLDANVALEEIRKGNARGSKISLWGRVIVEKGYESLGVYIGSMIPYAAIGIFTTTVIICLFLAYGLRNARIETDETKLWVEKGGRLEKEMQYTNRYLHPDLQPTSEIVLQTTTEGNFTASLLDHLEFLQQARAIEVRHKYMTYTLQDLCFKNDFGSTTVDELDRILNHLNPCIIVTPLDCFWEGSLLHNPPKPVAPPDLCPNISNMTWSNVNVTELRTCLSNNYAAQFNELVEEGLVKAGVNGYINKPCITNRSDCPSQVIEPLREVLYNGCSGFASVAMKWPEQIIIGGAAFRNREPGIDPQALQTIIQLSGPGMLMEKFNDIHNDYWELDDYKEVLTKWKTEYIKLRNNYGSSETRLTNEEFYVWTSDSASRIVELFSNVNPYLVVTGYVLMLAYCALALARLHPIKSRANVGIVGLLLVVLASSAALGLCTYLGLDLNATSTQVLPFLVLGLGVDDMFVIADAFFELEGKAKQHTPIKSLIASTLRKVGPSITLTSITNSSGFFLAAIIPIPAMRVFALQVGIAIVFNYFALLFGLPSYLVLDTLRVWAKLLDFFCCIPTRCLTSSRTEFSSLETLNDIDEKTDLSCSTLDGSVRSKPRQIEMASRSSPPKGSVVGSRLAHGSSTNSISEEIPKQFLEKYADEKSFLTRLVTDYYSPCLQNYIIKGVIITLFIFIFGLSIYGASTVEDGLNLVDVLPKDTPEYGFVNSTLTYFAFYDIYINTKEMDYAGRQKELLETYHAVYNYPKVVKDGSTQFWLEAMIKYYVDIKEEYCAAPDGSPLKGTLLAALIKAFNSTKNTTEIGIELENCTFSFVEEKDGVTVLPEDQFYRLVTLWVALDPVNAGTARPEFQPPVPEWSPTFMSVLQLATNGNITPADPFAFTQIPMYVDNLQDTEDYKNLIKGVRSILEESESKGVYAYPRGIPFTFWEQYIRLRERVLVSCFLILVASFVASTVFFMSLTGALILVLMLALTAFEVFGFMGLTGIRFSAVPAVVVIVSVGVAVEFTAPLIFYFLKATSDKDKRTRSNKNVLYIFLYFYDALRINNDRMHQALEHRFTPIFNGGISTLLGIIMLAFTPFPFIRKYFFFIFLNLLIVGALNGLVLLPVLLSLIGPPVQVKPVKLKSSTEETECKEITISSHNPTYFQETLL